MNFVNPELAVRNRNLRIQAKQQLADQAKALKAQSLKVQALKAQALKAQAEAEALKVEEALKAAEATPTKKYTGFALQSEPVAPKGKYTGFVLN